MNNSFGPSLDADGVTFRLWAPGARRVELILDRPLSMQARGDGWYSTCTREAGPGTLYRFRIDGKLEVPDPASGYQPDDVNGPSEVIDHAGYHWQQQNWRGRPWEEACFLELHVGTFTQEGTFGATIEKLDHIAAQGFTAIELMPVGDFSGRRNWGYDGVLWYAPDSAYGRPEDLKALIDAAHARGLMVFLDVIYNHFGPEGNYIGRYAPAFFSGAPTPWGLAIDYRVPQVRAFAIENALHWLRDYRFDGLRLDAVHAITERGDPPVLVELSQAVGRLAMETGRAIHLVLENDDNAAGLLDPAGEPPSGRYRAQWNDDYHHAWHVLLTGERFGYYRDYEDEPGTFLARILSSGFAYQGEASLHRGGRKRGEMSRHLGPIAFVNFLQNHDQIGNRALGDRLVEHADARALEAALAITLLAPMPPLLFMGEEWGSASRFPFFCDFQGPLADAVRKGRREEFKSAYAELGDVPDPLAASTFEAAKLDWGACEEKRGRRRLTLVRGLLRVRHREIVPALMGASFVAANWDRGVLSADWRLGNGTALTLIANLSERTAPRGNHSTGRPIWGGPLPDMLAPWSVHCSIGEV